MARDPDDPVAEAQLVRRAQTGDAAAYGDLVELHRTVAFRSALLVLRDADEAEDVTQEAFVKGYLALGRFRAGEPFRPWIVRIALNEARNRRRATVRRASVAARLAAGGRPDPPASPESIVVAGETRARLLEAVDSLRDQDRLVIGCRILLDLPEAETATALGLPRGTVKSRLHRSLVRLRAILAEDREPLRAVR